MTIGELGEKIMQIPNMTVNLLSEHSYSGKFEIQFRPRVQLTWDK